MYTSETRLVSKVYYNLSRPRRQGPPDPADTGRLARPGGPRYLSSIHIYEIANRTRLESVLVSTESKLDAFSRLRARGAALVAHWRIPDDDISVELIAEEMAVVDGLEFLERFLRATRAPGWKTTLYSL